MAGARRSHGTPAALGGYFGIEIRPARPESRDKTHDRYAPGLHHMAFHAESPEDVDRIHAAMQASGATVLDPPPPTTPASKATPPATTPPSTPTPTASSSRSCTSR